MATQLQLNIQQAFVQKLKELAPANVSLADEIGELLGVSADSAYRRLRCETAISLDEAVALCNYFKVPFSAFTENLEGLVTFRYTPLSGTEESFYTYLVNMDKMLDRLLMASEKKVIYGAVDIPILHNVGYREIGCFKMFYWMRSLLGVKSLENKKFNPSHISAEMQQVGRSIYQKYNRLPSVEIWTDDLLFTTLKQVEYYWESGLFEKLDDALAVCENIREMVRDVQKKAALGCKQLNVAEEEREQNFQLYFSELLIGNNSIMAYADNLKMVFLSHLTFNHINTADSRYCNETEEWLEKHIQKATLISGSAEKQRMKFFNTLERTIDRTIERIKNN